MTETAPSKLPWVVAGVLGCGMLAVGGVAAVAVTLLATRSPAGNVPGTPRQAQPAPVSGVVSGTVRDERGEPIRVPGAVVTVMVRGTAANGERQGISLTPDAAGHFEVRPPEGLYFVEGWIDLPFEGRRYRFTLEPVDGDPTTHRPSGPGIVKDFVWKLTGPIAGKDASKFTGRHGGSLSFVPGLGTLPPQTRLSFKLTPLTARADGAEAAEITFETTRAALEAETHVGDWPLARYRLSGVATTPDGGSVPLKLEGYDYDRSSTTALEVLFPPGTFENVDPVLVPVLGPGH